MFSKSYLNLEGLTLKNPSLENKTASQVQARLSHTIKGQKIERVVFLDFDDTLFRADAPNNSIKVNFTGGSPDRWRAFAELLTLEGSLLGVITSRSRHLAGGENIYNGLPDLSSEELSLLYHISSLNLLGYTSSSPHESLAPYLSRALIYFTGGKGSKGDAMRHAVNYHLPESFPADQIYLIDDLHLNRKEVVGQGFKFIRVPEEVYCLSYDSESDRQACADFMLSIFKKLEINPKKYPQLYERITRVRPEKHISDEGLKLPSGPFRFWPCLPEPLVKKKEPVNHMDDMGLKLPSGPLRFEHCLFKHSEVEEKMAMDDSSYASSESSLEAFTW